MQAYIGEILLFGGNFAPKGCFICDGRLVPIAQYPSLYSIMGTRYGGDGTKNFALPDLRDRTPHPEATYVIAYSGEFPQRE
ncbi:MAG TPA: tail fiber protein [Verrucomicrobiae bacterium]|nr:tail fiber protein [Verrucomicrobiae bacterium]